MNPNRDTTEEAARVNRAYEKILTMFEKGELNPEGGEKDERSDVFDRSEGEASSIFINPFSTPGMDPLEWKLLQEVRVIGGGLNVFATRMLCLSVSSHHHPNTPPPHTQLVRDAEDGSVDPEDVLRRAGVSVRAGAVHYLTQEQLAAVVEELEARHSRKPPGFPKRRRNGSHNTDDTLIDDFTL